MEAEKAAPPPPDPPSTVPTVPTVAPKTSRLRFDSSYFWTIGGILKLLQVFINLIGFILIQASGDDARLPRAVYYSFVSGSGLCISIILFLLYFVHLIEIIRFIPWFKVELVYCLLWILFHLVAGFLTVGLINGYFNSAGYFAFAAMAAYALEAFYNVCRITVRSV